MSTKAIAGILPHSLRSGRVQIESSAKKSQRTAEVRGIGSRDESYIAIGFEEMLS